jgi:hypothetical protein
MICEEELVIILCKLGILFMNIIQMTCDLTLILCHIHSFSFRNLLEIIEGNKAKAPEL